MNSSAKSPSQSTGSGSTPPTKKNSSLGRWLWPIAGLILLAYGLLAFNSGIKLSPLTNTADNNAEVAAYVYEQASLGVDLRGTPEVKQVVPLWANLMSEISSSQYAYGEGSAQQIEIFYFSMSEAGRKILSSHMMLGVILMVAGFLQFWPAFRRRFRKAHRVLGVLYILAALISMTMSGIHLVQTGIADTFNTYVFFVGLWFLLVGVLLSIFLATVALVRKDIARHLGWQALGFGYLLTAPLQRIDWLALSAIAGETNTFNEMNLGVNVVLYAQATLVTLLLFWLNRSSSPLKAKAPLNWRQVSPKLERIGYAIIFVLGLSMLLPMMVFKSIADIGFMQRFISESALNWLASVVDGKLVLPFAAAVILLLASAWAQLIRLRRANLQVSISRHLTSISAITVAAISLYWGYQLGLPSDEHSIAGSGFALFGVLILLFWSLMTYMSASNRTGTAVESLQLLLLIATAPVTMIPLIWFLEATGLVLYEYQILNAGYEIAIIAALYLPILAGFLLTMYSAETSRYRIS